MRCGEREENGQAEEAGQGSLPADLGKGSREEVSVLRSMREMKKAVPQKEERPCEFSATHHD
jgi:hypothetical protein